MNIYQLLFPIKLSYNYVICFILLLRHLKIFRFHLIRNHFVYEQSGDPLYVLLCCWLAAVGAGLLKSEEILEGVARLRISSDIEFEEETFIAMMNEAREVSWPFTESILYSLESKYLSTLGYLRYDFLIKCCLLHNIC